MNERDDQQRKRAQQQQLLLPILMLLFDLVLYNCSTFKFCSFTLVFMYIVLSFQSVSYPLQCMLVVE